MADVTIEIPNIGPVVAKNAATESTLRELVKALTGKTGGSGGGAGGGGAGGPAGGAAANMGKFSKEIENTTPIISKFGKGVVTATAALAKFGLGAIAAATGAAFEMGKTVMVSGNRLTDFASVIPLVGSSLSVLTSIIDSQVDTFRESASAGASFGNDMFGMAKAAATAEMNVGDFARMIGERSESMALFGSSITNGTRRFAELTKGLRTGNVGRNFMAMGFTMETLNEGFLNYSEEMARQGRLSGMSQQELVAGSAMYLTEIDKLAKVTGKNREELERTRQQNLTDGKIRQMANRLEGKARENFLNNLSQLDAVAPELKEAFADLSDGVAQTEIGQRLMATTAGKSAMALAQDMAAGKVSSAEFNNRLKSLGPELDSFFGGMSAAQLEALKETEPALYSLASATGALSRLQTKSAEDIKKEQNQRDKLTAVTSGVEQTFASLRSRIFDKILNSAVFQRITDLFAKMVPNGEMVDSLFKKMEPTIEKVLGWFDKFVTDLSGADNPMDVIKKYLVDAAKNIWTEIKKALGFGGGDKKEGAGGEGGAPKKEGGLLQGLLGDFSLIETLFKVGGTLILGLTALAGVLALFGAGPVALGIVALSGLLLGTGYSIKLAGEGIANVSAALKEIATLDSAGMEKIGNAMVNMGKGLAAMAGGSILEGITSLFGGGLGGLAKDLKKFEGLDTEKLKIVGEATGNIAKLASLSDKIDSDPILEYAKALETLVEALKEMNKEMGKGGAGGNQILSNIANTSSGSSQTLENLNSTMMRIEELIRQGNRVTKTTSNRMISGSDLMGAT